MLNRDEFRLGMIFGRLGSSVAPNIVMKIGGFLYSLERESVKRLLLSSAHLLQERLERNEAVIVSGVAQLLHQVLGLLLGQLLTEVHQQLEQLELQDGVVGILSYSFRISTKSWKPPWPLESLQALYMGKTSGLDRNFSPLAQPPPISLMVFRVGFRLQARMRSPA